MDREVVYTGRVKKLVKPSGSRPSDKLRDKSIEINSVLDFHNGLEIADLTKKFKLNDEEIKKEIS
jgi:hypothetical protein